MSSSLEKKVESREAIIGFIGMGYVGLSLLEVFGKAGFPLIGYDINSEKVAMIKREESYFNFLPLKELFATMREKRFEPTTDAEALKRADILLICVPTSLDRHHLPDLTFLRMAFQTVAASLKKGMLVILQSTTYPGTTEEELLPLLEKTGLKVGQDFYLACVPETADIGNPNYTFNQVPKIISGVTPACVKITEKLYQVAQFETVPCPSTKVAEAAKLLQNSFRLINISFINEMKIMLDRMNIDVWEVIKAASTKPFGFTAFYPSPGAGGDCIPVDPEYLIWKARETDGPTSLIELAEQVNRMIPSYVLHKLINGLDVQGKPVKGASVLVLGVGYKKDVNDIRESAALPILSLLQKMSAEVHYHDPFVKELPHLQNYPELHLKSVDFDKIQLKDYDAVIVTADHTFYNWNKIVEESNLIIDTLNATAGVPGEKKNVIKA